MKSYYIQFLCLDYALEIFHISEHFSLRFGIKNIKLQHGAGYTPLSVSCDYKSTGICQHPLLHDMDGRKESASFELIGDDIEENTLYTDKIKQFNTKSGAARSAARIKGYKSKNKATIKHGGKNQVMSVLLSENQYH